MLSMKQITYHSVDGTNYTITIEVDVVGKDIVGKTLVVTPKGIEKR